MQSHTRATQTEGLLSVQPSQTHSVVVNSVAIVPDTNSEVGVVWTLKLSATTTNHQQSQMEALVPPQDTSTITSYSNTVPCPGCNCWIQLCARLEIQRAGIVLGRLHIVRLYVQNNGFMRRTGVQHDHGNEQEFCILVKLQCEGVSTDAYWKATV